MFVVKLLQDISEFNSNWVRKWLINSLGTERFSEEIMWGKAGIFLISFAGDDNKAKTRVRQVSSSESFALIIVSSWKAKICFTELRGKRK
ncbi:hypothetical protein DVH24_016842 [Malus domestica]|uniref:Uncharacterized protein n=1 Tax=Malus domestica TaxID=3750 RepID=A0A498HTE3_MALDO|nr:hypothetical protein DVH24_016842 [Malus domestica]